MKLSSLTPVLLLAMSTLTACGGGSDSPAPTPTPDTTAPVITLNGDSALTHSAGTAYADLGATASDSKDGTVSVTMSGSVNSDVVNSYTITYSATDAAGNKTSLTRTVNVVDTTAPAISLEGDSDVTHSAGTEYVDAGATATDNIDGDIEVTTTGSVDSTKVGSYTLTYTAADAAGNSSTETRTVIVADDTAPVLVLNGANPLTHNAFDTYTDLGAVATDNVDEASDIVITTSGEVNADVIASYTVTYTATDSVGNQSSLTRTVNVADIAPPVITLNGEATITLSNSAPYVEQDATAVDAVDPSVTVTKTGDVLTTPGTYTVTYSAIDAADNEATATRTVTVEEDVLPEVFTFTAKNDVFLNTEIESDVIAINGLNIETPVSITGGEYSINNEPYTAEAGTITSSQNIKVRTTSATTINELKQVSLTIGSLTNEFDVTTRVAEPSGLFEGTGTVNGATSLTSVKGIISNEHFLLFDELAALTGESILYDGNILAYTGNDFTASVDVYKDGVKIITVSATGSITNQTSFVLTLTGDTADYGQGTINVAYDSAYEIPATQARFKTEFARLWGGQSNSVNQGYAFALSAPSDANDFTGGIKSGAKRCVYDTNGKFTTNTTVNIFTMSFDAENLGSPTCDHLGTDYKGYASIFNVGLGGIMWFAATNGVNSTFSVLTYQ